MAPLLEDIHNVECVFRKHLSKSICVLYGLRGFISRRVKQWQHAKKLPVVVCMSHTQRAKPRFA